LRCIQCPERRHRSQKSSDLLIHRSPPKASNPGTQRGPPAIVPPEHDPKSMPSGCDPMEAFRADHAQTIVLVAQACLIGS
jgi:hypothetical protein